MGIIEKLKSLLFGKPEAEQSTPCAPATTIPPEQPPKEKTYKVTSIDHRLDGFMQLASKNDDFRLSKKALIEEGLVSQRVYEYDFYATKAELVPEPDNPVDPKAIKVVVDGLHVGYIKAGSCTHLLKVLREDRIERISVALGGGKYKKITEVYNEDGDEVYELETYSTPWWVHLNIIEK